MASDSAERQALDAAHGGRRRFAPLIVTPFLVAYFATSLIVERSLNALKGPLIVVAAVLLVASLILEWRKVRPTNAWRVAAVVGSGCIGVLLAILVSG